MSREEHESFGARTEEAMPEKARKIERLRVIETLVGEARAIADDEGEHLLGAKLDDCALCAIQRLDTLQARGF